MVGYDRANGKPERVNVEAHKDGMTAHELRVDEAGSATWPRARSGPYRASEAPA